MKYAWVTEHRDSFPIALNVPRAGCESLGLLRLDRPGAQQAC